MPIRRLLKALGLQEDAPAPQHRFLARVHQQLRRLGPERIEYLAAFAGQLARVALVDSVLSDREERSIEHLLRTRANLGRAETRLVVELMRHEAETLKREQNHLLNRAFNEHASSREKEQLIDCLYAVAAVDDVISNLEDQEVRRIAEALLVPRRTLMAIRSRYKDHLEVIQFLSRRGEKAG